MRGIETQAVKQEQFKIYTQDNKTFIKSDEQPADETTLHQEMLETQYNHEMDQAMVISQEQVEQQQSNQQTQNYYDEFIQAMQEK